MTLIIFKICIHSNLHSIFIDIFMDDNNPTAIAKRYITVAGVFVVTLLLFLFQPLRSKLSFWWALIPIAKFINILIGTGMVIALLFIALFIKKKKIIEIQETL
jgi:hypothetical protein